jgi:carbamate kinase
VTDADRALAEGEFPPGSMGPKIESARHFVAGGGSAVITTPGHLRAAVEGDDGTWVVPDREAVSA